MDMQHPRGRSPSVGAGPDGRIRHSPSPQPFGDGSSSGDIGATTANTSNHLNPNSFNSNLAPPNASGSPYHLSSQYQQFSPNVLPSNDFGQDSSNLNTQPNSQYQADLVNLSADFNSFSQQQEEGTNAGQYDNTFVLDPQLQGDSQQQQQQQPPQDRSINPADLMSNMSSPQVMHPTPPGLLAPHSNSSEPTSPFTNPGQHWSPNHSRQNSLNPSSAVLVNGGQQDWQSMLQRAEFQGHRRAPSEYSDVSSSAAPSPFLARSDNFDSYEQSHSPLMPPQPESQAFTDGLNIEGFNISDNARRGASPAHSPFVSPMMSPHPGPGSVQDVHFLPLAESKNGLGPAVNVKTFPNQHEQFPQFSEQPNQSDYGQADQIPPPEIQVDFAPSAPHAQRLEPPGFESGGFGALSPPERGRRGNRLRAKSDTFVSRPTTPSSTVSTLGSNDYLVEQRNRSGSLSPNDYATFSRESSPGARSASANRRSSTSAIPNRDYILDLADPNRPSNASTERRIQKHPATFQCHLCPKKFTRAYNLRSHLRTHTDERPFVCNVCSKAFARQHDRKRHEGLHSGEKKFVCRGELGNGTSWGCGRRFARADALGRHFRSEAGRVCIKPLLDEEALDRQRSMDDHMLNQNMQMGGLSPAAAMNGPNQGVFTLPAALLAQYPALQGLQWDQLSVGGDEGDISGRSSFDAGSGNEYYDDDDDGGYMSDNPMPAGYNNGAGAWAGAQG